MEDLTRRNFITQSGVGVLSAAGLVTPIAFNAIHAKSESEPKEAPTRVPPAGRLGVAIVGLGRLALEEILPAIGESQWCRPTALVSGDRAKAERVAAQYGVDPKNIYDYKTFDAIKQQRDVDFVYIVLPNSMHEEFTVRAAAAGKHVLCEKPMANSSAEAERMIKACAQASRKLMIAYRIQYEPHHVQARRFIEEKKLGTLRFLQLDHSQTQGDPKQWRLKRALAGGGSLPDIGLYCLNTARFLVGEEPNEISARMTQDTRDARFHEVEDSVFWTMRFPSGVVAQCSTSYSAHKSNRYRIAGSDAWLEMDPAFEYEGLRMRVGRKESVEEHLFPVSNQFTREMDHFATCIAQNKTPQTPGEEGLRDLRLMEAIYEAARTSKVISLG